MTASRHKMKMASLSAFLLGTILVFGHAAVAQQSAEESQEESSAAPAATAEQATGTQADSGAAENREDRFFLGARPQLRRQIGPVLGKPRSILPRPFVPVGSVTMATPSTETPTETSAQGQAASDGTGLEQTITDDLATAPGGTPAADADQSGVPLGADALADPATDPLSQSTFLSEATLETIDPSGLAALTGDAALPADFWGETSRAQMIKVLETFAQPTRFIPMRDVARRVALSPINLPAPEQDTDVTAFMAARLAVLAAHGDQAGYLDLLARLPKDYDWSGIARQQADGYLIGGRIEDACALAAAERADSSDPYWLRLAAFCRAVAADRVGVDFQLGILEELTDIQPTFYQLIDQILVEAEQGNSAVLTNGLTLTDPLQVDVLEATMARLAKVQVPVLALDTVNPLAADTFLGVPGVAGAAKLQLMTVGLARGWLSPRTVSAYLETAETDDRPTEDVLMQAEVDDHFEVDLALLQKAMSSETVQEREPLLTLLWQRAVRHGRTSLFAPVIRTVLADKAPDDLLAAKLALRGNLMDARPQVLAATTDLRAGRVGDDPVKDTTLLASWPLMATAIETGAPEVSDAALTRWWQPQADVEGGAGDAALLFTTLEALGYGVPERLWRSVEEGAEAVATGQVVSPALWRRLLLAAAEEDKGEVLSLAYRMTATGQVSDAFVSSLVATLAGAGLEAEARQVATHMLVGRGL